MSGNCCDIMILNVMIMCLKPGEEAVLGLSDILNAARGAHD